MTQEIRITLQQNVTMSVFVLGNLVETKHFTYKSFCEYLKNNRISFRISCPAKEMFPKRAKLIEAAGYMITPVKPSEFSWAHYPWNASYAPGFAEVVAELN